GRSSTGSSIAWMPRATTCSTGRPWCGPRERAPARRGTRDGAAHAPGRARARAESRPDVGARRPILLDTGAGMAGYVRLLMSFLGDEGLEDVSRVILTHRHVDHIGGVPDVRRAFPRVPVAKLVKNDASLPVSMESLADGAVIRGDGVTLRAIYTPGHASDHLCYYLEEERALFSG